MIKLCCDRCGEEILDLFYYTIKINRDTVCTNYNSALTAVTSVTGVCNSNTLQSVNHEKQYCKKCKDEIEAFINKV